MAPSKVSFPKTAKEALEWSLHYIVESGHDSTFPEEFGLDFGLTDVAMLDPKKIEEEGLKSPAYVGLDLETSLDGLIRDAQVWQYSRMVHLWLYQTPNKKLKAEVEELMDYELKAFGVDTQGEKMTFSTKVGVCSIGTTQIILLTFSRQVHFRDNAKKESPTPAGLPTKKRNSSREARKTNSKSI